MANPIINAILNQIHEGKKLVILAGAGLSMATPTEMDGGADVAGRVLDEVRHEIEDFPESNDPGQVYDELFSREGQHGIQRFVGIVQQVGFANHPVNAGHKAIIKLYLEGVIDQVYSLNVDPHLENCSNKIILPGGWNDLQNLNGTVRTHAMCYRYGLNSVVGPLNLPWLQKMHGCINLDPGNTIWSAAALASVNWPANVEWAEAGLETCVQNRPLVVVGCGYPVSYINQTIQNGKLHSPAVPPSYLVSMDSFENYTNKNAALLGAARIAAANYLQESAIVFLPGLLVELSKTVLNAIRLEVSGKWNAISAASLHGSLFLVRRDTLNNELTTVFQAMSNDLDFLQKILRRSFLWRTPVSNPEFAEYYIPLRLNINSVADLLGAIAILKASLPLSTLDEAQAICTLRTDAGRPVFVVHCRGTSAVTVRDEIICGLVSCCGPALPDNLIVMLLNTNALAEDILKIPPQNRTRPGGKPSRVAASIEMPDSWRITTEGDTINRAPFVSVEEWDALVQGIFV